MAVTTEWFVETLEYSNNDDKIVARVHWRCRAWEDVNDHRYATDDIGVAIVDETTTDADGFIAYAELPDSVTLGWAWGKIAKDQIESRLKETIAEQTSPALKSGKPWE